jgi:hypothetical protein
VDLELTGPVVAAIAGLVDADSAVTHSQLDRLFAEAGLRDADPRRSPQDMIGKRKRVQAVLEEALRLRDPNGGRLVVRIVEVLQGTGDFAAGGRLAQSRALAVAQEALDRVGFALSDDGSLMPLSLDNLTGLDLTDALTAYVHRARAGSTDAALVTGTSKDLTEAVARHILVEKTGGYPAGMNFPGTLYQAFYACGLPVPSGKALTEIETELSDDPRTRVYECLYLLATAINRLRNSEGAGHGRPFPASVSDEDARVSVESMGLVSELLLAHL